MNSKSAVDSTVANAYSEHSSNSVAHVGQAEQPSHIAKTNQKEIQLTPPDSEQDFVTRLGVPEPKVPDDTGSAAIGQLKINGGGTSYVGSAHWATILDGIADLKRELDSDDDNDATIDDVLPGQNEASNVTGSTGVTGSLLQSPKVLTKSELLQRLPPRHKVDQLLATWFSSSDPFKAVIHKIQFEIEYQQFWNDPQAAPTIWIALLYAIMSLGCFFRLQRSKEFATPQAHAICSEADEYHKLSASALVLGEYMTPKPFTIEALLLYLGLWRAKAADLEVWLLLGVVVRLALRMGYHRDASHYGKLSPYACEMRRRTYAILYMSDVLISFHLGLPGMLRTIQSDTQPPHNILDQDFGVDSIALPPERPVEEFTPSAYGNAKVRICRVFSNAAELSHLTSPPSYDAVMAVDAELEHASANIPPSLRKKAFEMRVTESPEVILCCINLDILLLKTKCVLHRRFMVNSATEPAMAYSRRACVESSMQMLRHHHTTSEASRAGGRLESVSWYIESYAKADFLMAAMIVCLELNQSGQEGCSGSASTESVVATREEMMKALEKTKAIWEESIRETTQLLGQGDAMKRYALNDNAIMQDTMKACKAMERMLHIVKNRQNKPNAAFLQTGPSTLSTSVSTWPASTPSSVTNSTMVPNMHTIDQDWQYGGGGGYAKTTGLQDLNPTFDSMMSDIQNIDWTTWEQQLGAQNQEDILNWRIDDLMGDGGFSTDDLTVELSSAQPLTTTTTTTTTTTAIPSVLNAGSGAIVKDNDAWL
ncbi:hypothetical protein AAFC00_001501 [Neodothiora populina]